MQVAYEPLPSTGPLESTRPAPAGAQPPAGPQPEQAAATGQPRDGADADDEGWVVLYEERLVVRTEWVPVERVRLRSVGVQGQEVVNVDLSRERIDVDVEPAADASSSAPPAAR